MKAGAFPERGLYAEFLHAFSPQVREPGPRDRFGSFSERHLQAVWYDDALRPSQLVTADGERVTVDCPGQWNLAEGPDFRDARLTVEPGRRTLRGDVEVHIRPGDWQQHGHDRDPRYRRVIAHVTYYAGAVATPGALAIALQPALQHVPGFSFEAIDLDAYPHAARGPETGCNPILGTWPAERRNRLLVAAAHERMHRKAERMKAELIGLPATQVLYRETLRALGYHRNTIPGERLATALPLDELRERAAGSRLTAYALLLGTAGLLPAQTRANWDAATRRFVRTLWDAWWPHEAALVARALPRNTWTLAGRPQNNPLRRLAVAAELFHHASFTDLALAHVPPPLMALLDRLTAHPGAELAYWARHMTLAGRALNAAAGLLGLDRAAGIAVNVLIPLRAALGLDLAAWLAQVPPEPDNSRLREARRLLLGRDLPPSALQEGLVQQGLLQIFEDFCAASGLRCAACVLPARLRALASHWESTQNPVAFGVASHNDT